VANIGVNGGQTLTGGTASGNHLILSSTSHATKGKIYIGNSAIDEANNRIGINVSNPSQALSVNGNGWFSGRIYAAGIENANARENSMFQLNDNGVRVIRNKGDNSPALEVFQEHSLSSGNVIQWRNSNNLLGVISHSGHLGLGVIAPGALLHLKAGTAAANTAPIKFTPGVNLATPENNALEWDGARLYQTNNSGARNTIAYLSDISGGGSTGFSSAVNINIDNGVQLTKSNQALLSSGWGGLSLGLGSSANLSSGVVFLGDSAGVNSSGWGGNIGIGMHSLRNNKQGNNIAIGSNALKNNNNYNSVAIGPDAASGAAGAHIIAIGPGALSGNLNNNNIGVGRGALASTSSGGNYRRRRRYKFGKP
jgi:hypothetical protein